MRVHLSLCKRFEVCLPECMSVFRDPSSVRRGGAVNVFEAAVPVLPRSDLSLPTSDGSTRSVTAWALAGWYRCLSWSCLTSSSDPFTWVEILAAIKVFLLFSRRLNGRCSNESASRAADPGIAARFARWSHTAGSNTGTLTVTLLGAWRYRVSAETGWPGVRRLYCDWVRFQAEFGNSVSVLHV